jgi:tetratricopeptide (TPR) repeat protein
LSRQALAMRRKLLGEHPRVARSLIHLSGILRDEGKLPEAETTAREGWLMRRKLLGDAHPGTADSLDRLADILVMEGKYNEAESLLLEACSKMPTEPNTDPVIQSNLYARLASLYTKSGKSAQAAEWKNKLAGLPPTETEASDPKN